MSHPHRRPALSRRCLLGATASAAAICTLAGCAAPAWARQGLASLEVFDRDAGRSVPVYSKDGRQFVPGRPGARYALRLRNLTAGRVLVVLAVDGVNVVSGETADWHQVGYVLDPGRSYDINGWRKSGNEVAAFEFAPVARSYAALTGRPDNVGVIGMAVFLERVAPPPLASVVPAPPYAARAEAHAESRADAAAGAGGQLAAQAPAREKSVAADAAGTRLGTGHGPREWSVSRRTSFERANDSPEQVIELEYDSHERLVAAGVIGEPFVVARPRPFPSNLPGFVADPPSR